MLRFSLKDLCDGSFYVNSISPSRMHTFKKKNTLSTQSHIYLSTAHAYTHTQTAAMAMTNTLPWHAQLSTPAASRQVALVNLQPRLRHCASSLMTLPIFTVCACLLIPGSLAWCSDYANCLIIQGR